MKKYELNDTDKKLIEIGLEVLKDNFDDGVYNILLAVQSYVKTATFTKV